MKTEAEHLYDLTEALALAVAAANALAFYRQQGNWTKIAVLLDNCRKKAIELACRRSN